MSKADWGYLLLAWLYVFWWFATRLDRLGRQSEYETFLIRREMAELLGKERRADELREEDDGNEQERKKARQQETIVFGVTSAGMFAWWWYTGAVPFASLWHATS
jgi:hypothetical protein